MKYAVIYQSKSGNTKLLAERIFQSIDGNDKTICDLDEMEELPEADVYFIGFGIHNNSCRMDILNLFDELGEVQYALFATCGYLPTDQYRKALLKNLDVWLPESATMVDLLLCQGRVESDQKEIMMEQSPEVADKIQRMFEAGDSHPDPEDLDAASEFAKKVQTEVEHGGSIETVSSFV